VAFILSVVPHTAVGVSSRVFVVRSPSLTRSRAPFSSRPPIVTLLLPHATHTLVHLLYTVDIGIPIDISSDIL